LPLTFPVTANLCVDNSPFSEKVQIALDVPYTLQLVSLAQLNLLLQQYYRLMLPCYFEINFWDLLVIGDVMVDVKITHSWVIMINNLKKMKFTWMNQTHLYLNHHSYTIYQINSHFIYCRKSSFALCNVLMTKINLSVIGWQRNFASCYMKIEIDGGASFITKLIMRSSTADNYSIFPF